ncbi:MAG: bifunctional DNA-formamidopyrimidine glycosylase/DNA-(apurinic or apyrimidinic site) lyase [Deltaproteobacteria bacterium]|jgi:formamidopyrimidine-DNA glycosylase|nr:bifunctional DNA-formamidopyrimidine glycosylase/DNA-(apurinic or apyrimidinic site) lyase [Deltaproteobacteria bacterium]
MPELPEAETVAREMAARTRGWKIAQVLVNYAPIVASDWKSFSGLLENRTIDQVRRLGKFIVFDLSGGHNLVVHLRMTGQFHFGPFPKEKDRWPAHCHAAFRLVRSSKKEEAFFYQDTRKFGRLRAFGEGELEPFLSSLNLGPDALTADPDDFHRRLTGTRRKLKAVLLDQTVISGFGNIYADETLLAARISPLREARLLTFQETEVILAEGRRILLKAIECRGSTVSSYQAPEGAGSYQDHHLAYGRGGKPCPFCGRNLEKIKAGGRTTVYCPGCQK